MFMSIDLHSSKDILINWLNQILMKEQKSTHIQFLLKKLIQISS